MRSLSTVSVLLSAFLIIHCATPEEQAREALEAGRTALANSDELLAVEQFTKATKLEPGMADAWASLAKAQLGREMWSGARDAARKAAEIDPSGAEHQETIGRASVPLEDWDSARDAFAKAVKLDSNRSSLYFDLGRVQERLDQTDVAMQSYERAVTAGAEKVRSRLALARLHLDRQHLEQAELHLDQVGTADDVAEELREELTGLQERLASAKQAKTNRFGIRGPSENQDPQLARDNDRRIAQQAGILGMLQSNAPTSPFGRDSALGTDLENAVGAIRGNQRGEHRGFGGLGQRGSGRGGGGTGEGTIGLGSLGTRGYGGSGSGYGSGAGRIRGASPRSAVVRLGNATVTGGEQAIARRSLRRYINQLRYCYARELNRSHELAGSLTLRIATDAVGQVTSSTVTDSTISSNEVGACIARVGRRMRFPEPQSGDSWTIVVPMTFSVRD